MGARCDVDCVHSPLFFPGVPPIKQSETIQCCRRLLYIHTCLHNLRSGAKTDISQAKLPSAFIAVRFSVSSKI